MKIQIVCQENQKQEKHISSTFRYIFNNMLELCTARNKKNQKKNSTKSQAAPELHS